MYGFNQVSVIDIKGIKKLCSDFCRTRSLNEEIFHRLSLLADGSMPSMFNTTIFDMVRFETCSLVVRHAVGFEERSLDCVGYIPFVDLDFEAD